MLLLIKISLNLAEILVKQSVDKIFDTRSWSKRFLTKILVKFVKILTQKGVDQHLGQIAKILVNLTKIVVDILI